MRREERERGDEEGIVESRVVFRLFLGEMWREKGEGGNEREGKQKKKTKSTPSRAPRERNIKAAASLKLGIILFFSCACRRPLSF
jgi:hypothetical protein